MTPEISVIVPVYNVECLLPRCIDSILAQTFKNFELLLVDDGSKDSSGKICDDYSMRDKRVRVFHKENGGVSSARNLGLDNVRSKYVTFCDSDDWIKKYYLEHLLSHMLENTDLVISYAERFTKDESIVEKYPCQNINFDNFEIMFIENDMHWHTSPWSKLYKMSIINGNNLRFVEGMNIGEDACFLFNYMLKSENIYISSDTDYCYFSMVENSLTKQVYSVEKELFAYRNIIDTLNNLYHKRNIQDKTAKHNMGWIVAYYIRRVLNSLYHSDYNKDRRIETLKEVDISMYLRYAKYDFYRQRIIDKFLKYGLYDVYDFIRVHHKKQSDLT